MKLSSYWTCNHNHLCKLDVLDVNNSFTEDQMYVCWEFQDQLEDKAYRYCETTLLWTPTTTTTKLESYQEYVTVLETSETAEEVWAALSNNSKSGMKRNYRERTQKSHRNRIIHSPWISSEKRRRGCQNKKPVLWEESESTKLRILFFASTK